MHYSKGAVQYIRMNHTAQFLIGVDEVGRGALAGPVMVCAAAMEPREAARHLSGIRDSKKLTQRGREDWFAVARELAVNGVLYYRVASSSQAVIDVVGMTKSVRRAVNRSIFGLAISPDRACILLDGGLRAPEIFSSQTTIIKGDEKEPLIALASIIAKVTRDRLMMRWARKFPDYGFEIHKGYGTARHMSAIRQNGACAIHRRTFLKHIDKEE